MTVPSHILDRGVIATGRVDLAILLKKYNGTLRPDVRDVRQLSTGRIEFTANDGGWMPLCEALFQRIEWENSPTDEDLMLASETIVRTREINRPVSDDVEAVVFADSPIAPRSDRWMLTYASKDGKENETIPLDSSTAFRMLCESMQYESKMSDFLRVTEQMRATGKMFNGVNYNFWIKREGE